MKRSVSLSTYWAIALREMQNSPSKSPSAAPQREPLTRAQIQAVIMAVAKTMICCIAIVATSAYRPKASCPKASMNG